MTQNQSQNQIIAEARMEFDEHLKSGSKDAFSVSSDRAAELSKLRRDLEQKRQQDNILDYERRWLNDIDDLFERISRFNSNLEPTPEFGIPQIYQMNQKNIIPDGGEKIPYMAPTISNEEADKIIQGIDQQFEQKYAGEGENGAAGKQPAATAVREDNPNKGASLNEFLSSVRAERPNEAFSDEDSDFHLAKLKNPDQKR